MSTLRTHRTLRVLTLITAITLVGCGDKKVEHAAQAPARIVASTVRAERQQIPLEVEIHGTVEAMQTAAISTRVMAMVTAVHVSAGEPVDRGQLLLEIDPQASRGQVAQAQGALSQARAALALAERNFERFKALAEVKAASELEVDMARMQFEQASGAVEQAEGAVAAASSVAGDASVTAPFAGRVARKMVEVGDLAAPGRPLMMIESRAGRRLVTSIPESLMQRASITLGSSLPVRIDSRPDLGILQGSVTEMAPGADPASHSFQVKIDLPAVGLPSGAAGRARIPADVRAAVVVPRAAILRQGGLSMVALRTADGTVASRVVTVGQEVTDDFVEILSGLSGGETILIGLTAMPTRGAVVETQS